MDLNGEIVITAEKHRSQSKNRELAKSKLVDLILKALENQCIDYKRGQK